MKTRALLLAGLLCAQPGHAENPKREFWTWIDANGVTHFSDKPVTGARKIELTGVEPPSGAAAAAPAPVAAEARPDAATVAEYRSIEIWQPAQDETFFGADATVNVRMRTEPELVDGHRLYLYLDGKLLPGGQDSLEYTLGPPLERGLHSLTALIMDAQGKELIRSKPRVFNVRQPTVNPPAAVGPAVKPQPKPTPKANPSRG